MPLNRHILLVEDNAGDQRLTMEALRGIAGSEQFQVLQDGAEALSYLKKQEKYANAARPSLVILDLNLPKRDGRYVLNEIKQDPDLRTIPVIIFTTSKAETDIRQCYDLGANCYLSKPIDVDAYFDCIKNVYHYWMNVAELPR